MRKSIAVVALLMAVAVAASGNTYAACSAPVPMFHGFDSFIRCADGGAVSAYAWQVLVPATNTGAVGIACTTPGENAGACVSPISGTKGDGQVTIETDWSTPGVLGCPVTAAGPQRIALSLQCSDGTGVIVSLSGTNPNFGYIVELAHQTDGVELFPLSAGSDNARPKVVRQSVAGGVLTADLQFNPVRVNCDCDPLSVGFSLTADSGGTSCTDNFVCTGSAGTVYTRTGLCDSDPGAAIGGWVSTAVTPNASGAATISVPLPTGAGQCLFIGAPSVVGGNASSGITGHIRAGGSLAASDRAIEVRAAAAQGKVTLSFRTESELEAVSFDIVAKGRVVGSLPAKGGNGIGASYETSLKMGDFRGAKDFVVRTNLRNGGSNTTDPVSF